jgi:hypothetical protein
MKIRKAECQYQIGERVLVEECVICIVVADDSRAVRRKARAPDIPSSNDQVIELSITHTVPI